MAACRIQALSAFLFLPKSRNTLGRSSMLCRSSIRKTSLSLSALNRPWKVCSASQQSSWASCSACLATSLASHALCCAIRSSCRRLSAASKVALDNGGATACSGCSIISTSVRAHASCLIWVPGVRACWVGTCSLEQALDVPPPLLEAACLHQVKTSCNTSCQSATVMLPRNLS